MKASEMSNDLTSVKQLEAYLRGELEKTDLFRKWDSVRTTLELMSKMKMTNGERVQPSVGPITADSTANTKSREIPSEYPQNDWVGKFWFLINEMKSGFTSDFKKGFRRYGEKSTDRNLEKRISAASTKLEAEGLIEKDNSSGKMIYKLKTASV